LRIYPTHALVRQIRDVQVAAAVYGDSQMPVKSPGKRDTRRRAAIPGKSTAAIPGKGYDPIGSAPATEIRRADEVRAGALSTGGGV